MSNKYGFNIAWSDEDQGYVATCPEFSGLSAFGRTEEEALTEGKTALRLFLKTYEEKGVPLPASQSVQQYSGQTRVRLSKELHKQAAQTAAREGISLNRLIENAVAALLGKYDAYSHMKLELRQILADQSAKNSLAIASQYRSLAGESQITTINNAVTSTAKIIMQGVQPTDEANRRGN